MDFNTLNRKNIVNDKVVMTEPVVLFKEDIDIIVTHRVTEFELGRPDLIALKYYGMQQMTDLILKFNAISNPWGIELGDELEIPVYTTEFNKFIKPDRPDGESAKEKFIKQRRMTKKDIKRLEFLQKVSQNGALPVNRLKENEINKSTNTKITDLNPSNLRDLQ
tara:strand:+ start:2576 stop:3067 length:492 start_codon:yes stop_codon:yes gene_type:complete